MVCYASHQLVKAASYPSDEPNPHTSFQSRARLAVILHPLQLLVFHAAFISPEAAIALLLAFRRHSATLAQLSERLICIPPEV